ncbi:MAG: YdcF family protein [Rubritepida sp.]|nr:YdcF family protein [Rubritepida sp.]
MQAALTSLLLPPLALAGLAVLAGLLAWRGRRAAGAVAALAGLGLLALATPYAAGTLRAGLEARVPAPPAGPPPQAIVILGGDSVATEAERNDPGAFTLERLRAGAALHRASGLPVLVTGGPVGRPPVPLATLMADSLAADFGVPVRWIEPRATDTRQNATFSAELLRAAGVERVFLVTHGWHMPRSLEAFARAGLVAHAAPVRRDPAPSGIASDFLPRADHLGTSWYMLREWAGRIVYAWRDG